ncbi:hypothetical protein F4827_001056 [Paraburkholderia bannensis]|uniref:Uncharacterized protein n=1 Tax=Paraburkholderia bannensis TaxID=765414 RepID=A0A7W9TVZ5_9BURK|nr:MULTISPECIES: hypothetical protein [Paraburkholderia]MBB3256230.1 hypothetical protein [Paraburkholderia sp. WP4_3_2]MBB6101230.1 hypothetical protein [Paraburkholderia bannensis]
MKYRQFLEDGYGQLSATRLAFLVWVLGSFIVTALIAAKTNTFTIDQNVMYLIGILMTGKVAQSFSDNDGPGTGTPKQVDSSASEKQVDQGAATGARALPAPATNTNIGAKTDPADATKIREEEKEPG